MFQYLTWPRFWNFVSIYFHQRARPRFCTKEPLCKILLRSILVFASRSQTHTHSNTEHSHKRIFFPLSLQVSIATTVLNVFRHDGIRVFEVSQEMRGKAADSWRRHSLLSAANQLIVGCHGRGGNCPRVSRSAFRLCTVVVRSGRS